MLLTMLFQATAAAAGVSNWVQLGAGLAIGAGLGIGKIGGSAMEVIGRQPDAAGDICMNMIIAAALIEGVALLAIVVCFIGILFIKRKFMSLLLPESGLFVRMLLSFGIVFAVLAKYGFPIIIKMVEDRKVYIDQLFR